MTLRISIFLLVFAALSAVCGWIAGWAFAGLTVINSLAALIVAAAGGFLCAWRTGCGLTPPVTVSWGSWIMAFLWAWATWRSFVWLVFSWGSDWWIGSPYNVGDLALHWHLITYLASGVSFWPASPIFLEGGLRYPLGINLANALWVIQSAPLPQILLWTGILGSALAGYTLWRWAGAFGLATFLFSGGMSCWMGFTTGDFCAHAGTTDWKNLFLAVLVTQRGFLWALPAGVLLMEQWRARLDARRLPLPLGVEIVLYVLLPFFHLHTFLFMSLLLGVAVLLARSPERRTFFFVGCGALLPASLLVFLVTDGFSTSNGFAWQPGWMQGDEGVLYWWWNFGLWLPLFAWTLLRAFFPSKKETMPTATPSTRVFLLAGGGCILLCFLFRFAPWAWDNVKLLLWGWLALAPWVWTAVMKPLLWPIRTLLLILLFGGGAMELVCGLRPQHIYSWANRQEMAEAEVLLQDLTPNKSRFAALPDTPHPLMWHGFPVALGYTGHLWSHGYSYRPAEIALEGLLSSGKDATMLEEVTHVWIDHREREMWGAGIWSSPPPGWRIYRKTPQVEIWERIPQISHQAIED